MWEKVRPNEYVNSLQDVDFDRLWQLGIRGLFLDIDNTLMPFDEPLPPKDVRRLIQSLKQQGFTVCILSNGKPERVKRIAASLNIPCIWKAGKPLTYGISALCKRQKLLKREVAVIGDQLFTDVLGGNLAGCYSILLKPISLIRDEKATKPRRGPEKKLLHKMGLVTPTQLPKEPYKAQMKVDGKTELLAVIGDPIAHTLSPYIHQIFIDKSKDNYAYVPFHLTVKEFATALPGMHSLKVRGINVTIPHKQAVMPYLVHIDEGARLVGAVNTLKWTPEGYEGYNTDVYGFQTLVEKNEVPVRGSKVLILGAGGAAHSALVVSALLGAEEIYLYNRTQEKAAAMAREFTERWIQTGRVPVPYRILEKEDLEKESFPIVFNTTSRGMLPHTDELPVEMDLGEESPFYSGIHYGLDMVFNPAASRFVQTVQRHGGKAAGGLTMLFYQGLKSYEIWTERSFTETEKEEMHQEFLKVAQKVLPHE